MAQQPKPKAADPLAAATIRCNGCKTTVKGTDRRWMCPLCKLFTCGLCYKKGAHHHEMFSNANIAPRLHNLPPPEKRKGTKEDLAALSRLLKACMREDVRKMALRFKDDAQVAQQRLHRTYAARGDEAAAASLTNEDVDVAVTQALEKCSADQEKVLSGGGDAADSLPESVNFAVDIDMIVDVVLHENMEEEPEEPRVIEHDNQHYKLLKNAMDMKKYKRKRSYSQVPYGNDRPTVPLVPRSPPPLASGFAHNSSEKTGSSYPHAFPAAGSAQKRDGGAVSPEPNKRKKRARVENNVHPDSPKKDAVPAQPAAPQPSHNTAPPHAPQNMGSGMPPRMPPYPGQIAPPFAPPAGPGPNYWQPQGETRPHPPPGYMGHGQYGYDHPPRHEEPAYGQPVRQYYGHPPHPGLNPQQRMHPNSRPDYDYPQQPQQPQPGPYPGGRYPAPPPPGPSYAHGAEHPQQPSKPYEGEATTIRRSITGPGPNPPTNQQRPGPPPLQQPIASKQHMAHYEPQQQQQPQHPQQHAQQHAQQQNQQQKLAPLYPNPKQPYEPPVKVRYAGYPPVPIREPAFKQPQQPPPQPHTPAWKPMQQQQPPAWDQGRQQQAAREDNDRRQRMMQDYGGAYQAPQRMGPPGYGDSHDDQHSYPRQYEPVGANVVRREIGQPTGVIRRDLSAMPSDASNQQAQYPYQQRQQPMAMHQPVPRRPDQGPAMPEQMQYPIQRTIDATGRPMMVPPPGSTGRPGEYDYNRMQQQPQHQQQQQPQPQQQHQPDHRYSQHW